MIKLFVGLGNPGPEYEATRHNAGFWWVDELARELKVNLVHDRGYHGLVARANVHGQVAWLLEPQTFMNLSGKSVAALARFYKIQPEEILVVHDELDVVPGQAKLKFGGSHAGHNGLMAYAQAQTPVVAGDQLCIDVPRADTARVGQLKVVGSHAAHNGLRDLQAQLRR